MTMKPFEIQSPALSINGVLIDTSAQGKLVIPGVTRAGTSVAIEVEDTGDQTYSWGQGTDPNSITVIDGYTYDVTVNNLFNGGQQGWTAATYAVDAIDDEGYIDGISVVTGGAGYTGEAVTSSTVMFASVDGTSWQEIPFKVRCGAGEIESEFGNGGGANLGNLSVDSTSIIAPTNEVIALLTTTENSDDNELIVGSDNIDIYAYNGDADSYSELWLHNENTNAPYAEINVQASGGPQLNWSFNSDGTLRLPSGGDIVDHNGTSVLGGGGGGSGPSTGYKTYIVADQSPWQLYNEDVGAAVQVWQSDIFLPEIANVGDIFVFTNQGGSDQTISSFNNDGTIYHGTFHQASSILLKSGETLELTSRGNTEWDITGGSLVTRLVGGGGNANTGDFVFDGTVLKTTTGYPTLVNADNASASDGGVEIDFNSDTVSHSMWLNGEDGLAIQINRHLDPDAQSQWNFSTDGALTFPDGTKQTTAATTYRGEGYVAIVGDYSSYNSSFDAIAVDANRNVYYGGQTQFNGISQLFIIKIDVYGVVQWQKIITQASGTNLIGSITNIKITPAAGPYPEMLWISAQLLTDGPNSMIQLWLVAEDGSVPPIPVNLVTAGGLDVNVYDDDVASPFTPAMAYVSVGCINGGEIPYSLSIPLTNGGTATFDVLKTDVPALTLDTYSVSHLVTNDNLNYTITNMVESTNDSTYWTLTTNYPIDWAVFSGTLTLAVPTYTDAMIICNSNNWQKTLASAPASYEQYNSVIADSVNGYIYAVGSSLIGNASQNRSIVSKFNTSDGSVNWHKTINFGETSLDLDCVALFSNGDILTVGRNRQNGNNGRITRMAADGSVVWQVAGGFENTGDWMGVGAGSCIVDTNGNALVAFVHGSVNSQNDDVLLISLSGSDGSVLWERTIGTNKSDNVQSWNGLNFLSADSTHFYVSGSYESNNSNGAFAIKLPFDGSGLGIIGVSDNTWTYETANWNWITVDVSGGAGDVTDFVETDYSGDISMATADLAEADVSLPILEAFIGSTSVSTGNLHFNASVMYAGTSFLSGATGFINLDNGDGEVVIGSNTDMPLRISVNENNNPMNWTFNTAGALWIPAGNSTNISQGQIFSDNESSFINMDVQFDSDITGGMRFGASDAKPVDIVSNWNNQEQRNIWRFGADGNLILPEHKSIKAHADNNNGYSVTIDPDGVYHVNAGQDIFSMNSGPAGGSINTALDKSLFITTNEGQQNWEFTTDGKLSFPDGSRQSTAYIKQNVNLDGGGASVQYDAEVAFVDGGFSSTRHGVVDPTFDGGNTLTEINQLNLDGGRA